jgi:hypothetical protein
MLNWNIFISAALGRIVGSLLVGICIVLGFGPTAWAEFLISGMPVFLTPGIARLGLLLIASVVIFFEWRLPLQNAIDHLPMRARRLSLTAFGVICCLPFVAGAFYVTAMPNKPDRHLSASQKTSLAMAFRNLLPNSLPNIVVASVDDPEAVAYAEDIIYFFKYYNIPVHEIYADPPDNKVLLPYSVKQIGRVTGMEISVYDTENPPEAAELLRKIMQTAGFKLGYQTFHGRMPTEFMLTISYN